MRFFALVTLILVVLPETWRTTTAIKWLSIATVSTAENLGREGDGCDVLDGLVRRQKQICRKHVELMEAVRKGALEAIQECQAQFKSRRWNCSTVDKLAVFGKIMSTGTREMAFIHAISSAGVAHAVTRACSTGALERCGCDRTVDQRPTDNFEWAGCSDNVAYGSAFSRAFVDARERVKGKTASRALMNLHNNNAGRKTTEEEVRTQCKCHGVSGSCELRTCWRSLPSFKHIGTVLKDKFDAAAEVEERLIGTRRELAPKSTGTGSQSKPHSDTDLVYIDASPDFCEADAKTGSLGTHGRPCNKTSRGTDGCELMCCGRGFSTRQSFVTERCQCKFHWCCYVKCQKCRVEVEEYICR